MVDNMAGQGYVLKSQEERLPQQLLLDINKIADCKTMSESEREMLKKNILSQLSAFQNDKRSDLVVRSLTVLARYLSYAKYVKPLGATAFQEIRKTETPYAVTRSIFNEFPKEAVITLTRLLMTETATENGIAPGATYIIKDIYRKHPEEQEMIKMFLATMLSGENYVAKINAAFVVAMVPVRELYNITELAIMGMLTSTINTNMGHRIAELSKEIENMIKSDRKKNPELQPKKSDSTIFMFQHFNINDLVPKKK